MVRREAKIFGERLIDEQRVEAHIQRLAGHLQRPGLEPGVQLAHPDAGLLIVVGPPVGRVAAAGIRLHDRLTVARADGPGLAMLLEEGVRPGHQAQVHQRADPYAHGPGRGQRLAQFRAALGRVFEQRFLAGLHVHPQQRHVPHAEVIQAVVLAEFHQRGQSRVRPALKARELAEVGVVQADGGPQAGRQRRRLPPGPDPRAHLVGGHMPVALMRRETHRRACPTLTLVDERVVHPRPARMRVAIALVEVIGDEIQAEVRNGRVEVVGQAHESVADVDDRKVHHKAALASAAGGLDQVPAAVAPDAGERVERLLAAHLHRASLALVPAPAGHPGEEHLAYLVRPAVLQFEREQSFVGACGELDAHGCRNAGGRAVGHAHVGKADDERVALLRHQWRGRLVTVSVSVDPLLFVRRHHPEEAPFAWIGKIGRSRAQVLDLYEASRARVEFKGHHAIRKTHRTPLSLVRLDEPRTGSHYRRTRWRWTPDLRSSVGTDSTPAGRRVGPASRDERASQVTGLTRTGRT